MAGRLGLVVFLGLLCAIPASAGETGSLQCGVNEDRIWMYDSLDSFDVAAKLKCGEQVEVIGQEKGYVKIRTARGIVGYVPEKTLPNLPPPVASAPANNQPSSKLLKRTTPPQQPSVAARPASAAVRAATPAASSSRSSTKTGLSVASNQKAVSSQPTAVSSQTKTPAHTTLTAANSSDAQPKSNPSSAQAKPKPASASAANTQRAPSKKPSTRMSSKTATTISVSASVPGTPNTVNVADNVSNANVSSQPAPSAVPRTKSTSDPDEEEDASVNPLEDNSACRIYFSAYGLSPSQYKWLSQNRRKSFPGICPAPSTAMVDFVIIFTHDVDFYNVTMPTTVHIDKNGFSDFTPLTTVDTAVISPSDADKNRREYVWVFHTARGAFDPANFSAKRRPLFSKSESNGLTGSHAGGRTVEDALSFIQGHGSDR